MSFVKTNDIRSGSFYYKNSGAISLDEVDDCQILTHYENQ